MERYFKSVLDNDGNILDWIYSIPSILYTDMLTLDLKLSKAEQQLHYGMSGTMQASEFSCFITEVPGQYLALLRWYRKPVLILKRDRYNRTFSET